VAAASTSTYLQVFEDLEELSAAAAEAFAESARRAVRERGRFSVALAGGGTPRTLYRCLAAGFRDSIPWSGVHLFWSDERFVPPEDPDSNYRMVRESLLELVGVPEGNVHRPETDLDDAEESALRYERALRSFFGPEPPRFDWMLLGLGEDGHVASLFPGAEALEERERLVVAIRDSPKPPRARITMTLPLINQSRETHFLVSGREKHGILFDVLRGAVNGLPARRVQPRKGSLHWWLDRDAAAAPGRK
jgi:6-phosphogluconolactonase